MNNVIGLHDGWVRQNGVSHMARPAPAGNNDMAELLLMLGANLSEMRGLAPMPVAVRRLQAGDMLFHEGAEAEAMHFVRAGTFKIFRTAEDGYEQVLGFAGRGEVMGCDAISAGTHPTAAMALEDSSVFVVLLCDFFSLGQRISALDTLVHRAASSALAHRAELAELMAAVAAEVRLARFLLKLSQRMAAYGQSPRRFHLRMSRRDIASYLGVAHETVSRSFGALVRWRLVSVDNREVEVLNMPGLRAFALNTRRQVDEGVGASFARAQALPHDTQSQVS